MFESIEQAFPEQWRVLVKILLIPISWIPVVQKSLFDSLMFSDYRVVAVLKWIFLLLPSLLFIVGAWCTMLAIYTYPFRKNRNTFVVTLFITWWDSLRSVWLFWSGAFRFVWLFIGWFLSALRFALNIIFELVKQLFYFPVIALRNMGKQYFRAGIPWIAVFLTLIWVTIEATIFTYVLTPTISELLSGIVGKEVYPQMLNIILFSFLFLLIGGSFACVQGIADAFSKKDIPQIIQMIIWELFVVMVEVLFLYRDLVDAIAPWFYQQTNESFRLGFFWTIGIAFFAWIGIRAMTWFLFARYGTSTLIAIIARKPIQGETQPPEKMPEAPFGWMKTNIDSLKSDIEWFNNTGKEFLEALALPALQVLASAINFCLVFVTARPLFSLPFKHIEEVMETKELILMFEKQKKNVEKED